MGKISLLFLGIIAFVFLFIISLPYYSGDVKNHVAWAQSLLEHGTWGFFERDFPGFAFPNYPPIAMLLFAVSLALFNFLKDSIFLLNSNFSLFPSSLVHFFEWENTKITFLKLPAIVSNILIALALYNLHPYFFKNQNQKRRFLMPLLFILNPATIYLSAVWGQIDLLPITFLLFSIISILKKRIYWAGFLFSLALLSKQTSIIFLPIFLIWIFKDFGTKHTIKFIILNVMTIFLLYLPFHLPSLSWLLGLFQKNFDLVAHSVGENAFNLWGLLYNFQRSSDETYLGPLTLQYWGYLIFLVSILPAGYLFIKKRLDMHYLFILLIIVSMSYYFFLTRMHERYLIPVIVFLTIPALKSKKYLLILLFFSVLQFLNLYKGLFIPDIPILDQVVNSIVSLRVLVIGYLISLIYTLYLYAKKEY